MHIDIATRLKPYSSFIGTHFVLPLSSFRIQVFPSLLHIDDLSTGKRKATLQLSLNGPFEDFFVQQDLERSLIVVSGKSHSGFFRYILKATESQDGIIFYVEKGQSLTLKSEGSLAKEICTLNVKESTIFGHGTKPIDSPVEIERLSLGSHKSQDFELIKRKKDFFQILPLWHRLGQLCHGTLSFENDQHSDLPLSLLEELKKTFKSNPDAYAKLKNLFFAGFDFAFSPRSKDNDHQGILQPNQLVVNGSPLQILSSGFHLIRSLFIETEEDEIQLLPALPTEFHSGRLLNAKILNKDLCLGRLSLEWSKKEIRRVIFMAEQTTEISFDFCRKKQKCRLRASSKDKGQEYISRAKLILEAGKTYWLDNFQ